jgi:glycogen(starch) synthase
MPFGPHVMRILIATDAFPPVAGGSGWSTYELARGLRARGHHLFVVQPYSGRRPEAYDGFDVIGFPVPAPPVPFVRNYFRNERLYRRLATYLGKVIVEERIDLIHAQHELTGPAAVMAARAKDIPSVCTVRDYWPVCYWSDLVRDPAAGDLCPGCSAGAMTRCLPPRVGAAWPLTAPFIPYMRANLRRKQSTLAAADAIVAVSARVAEYLRDRAPEIPPSRIKTIPNGVDVARIRAHVRASLPPMKGAYALFVGKLAKNKGVSSLVEIVERARLGMPLVIIGSGPERGTLIEAAAKSNHDIRVLDWLDRDEVFRWLGHAAFLIFPSSWPEPLSRVLLEAGALGIPVAAVNTGGTTDIVVDEATGLLSASADELVADVARLASDRELRERLGAAAGKLVEQRFDVPVVIDRMEALYADVVARTHGSRGKGAA